MRLGLGLEAPGVAHGKVMIAHVLLALAMQLGIARLSGSLAAGTWAACAFAIAREITQAEYRWIERFGQGLRANMPWWGGLDMRVWHADAWLDWIAPCLVCLAAAYLLRRKEGPSRRQPGS